MDTPTMDEIIAELHLHDFGTQDANDPTLLADYVWMLVHGKAPGSFEPVWARIVTAMETLNARFRHQLWESGVPPKLAYAINGMMGDCLDMVVEQKCDSQTREVLIRLAWRILCAWDAVLAGDIDNIQEHVQEEEWGRFPEPPQQL